MSNNDGRTFRSCALLTCWLYNLPHYTSFSGAIQFSVRSVNLADMCMNNLHLQQAILGTNATPITWLNCSTPRPAVSAENKSIIHSLNKSAAWIQCFLNRLNAATYSSFSNQYSSLCSRREPARLVHFLSAEMKTSSGLGSSKRSKGSLKLRVVLQGTDAMEVVISRILYPAELLKYFPFSGKRCTTTYQKV